jgi:hypothetical protein
MSLHAENKEKTFLMKKSHSEKNKLKSFSLSDEFF